MDKFSSILHNFVVSAALIIGAVWAYLTYVHSNPDFMGLRDTSGVWSSENLKLHMEYIELDEKERVIEIKVGIKNLNRKNQILINYSDTKLRYKPAGTHDGKITEAQYERIDGEVEGFWLASNRDRELNYKITFPDVGAYIVEFDACPEPHSDCLVSRYVYAE